MKKKLLSVLLSFIILLTAMPLTGLTAFAATSGDFEYEILSETDKTCEIKKYNGNATDLTIPSAIEGYAITKIGLGAFRDNLTLLKVTIPSSITIIDSDAFSGCSSLVNVTIPNSVVEIESGTFRDCIALDNITIPESVIILRDAFWGCSSLKNITIPKNVNYIAAGTFLGCTSLTDIYVHEENLIYSSIDGVLFDRNHTKLICYPSGKSEEEYIIPNSVTTFEERAFMGCAQLKSIIISNNMKSIADETFRDCTSLTSIIIPNSVLEIGAQAFDSCVALTNINIPNSVTSIRSHAFYHCTSLEKIVIPDSMKEIDIFTFEGCSSLAEVIIPNSILEISSYAFAGCSALKNIHIPNSVTHIANNVFSGCTNLENIHISNNLKELGSDAFYATKYYNTSLNWADGLLYIDNYLLASGESISENCTIKAGTRIIADRAFSRNQKLSSINIPNTVIYIGSEAFYNSGLDSILWPNSVSDINEGTFYNCKSLSYISIPESVTRIGFDAFYGCENLETISLPDNSILSIEKEAFLNSGYYNNIANWTNGVLYIGNHLIEGRNDIIGECTVKDGTKTIAEDAFYMGKLSGVVIPNSVVTIGPCAFYECRELEYVNIEDTQNSELNLIGGSAFYNCIKLASFILPDSVKTIGGLAFCNTALSSITLNNIIELGGGAFNGCSNLISIEIFGGLTNIRWRTFEDCLSLIYITIPQSVEFIEHDAFEDCYGLNHIFYSGTQEEWNEIEIESDGNSQILMSHTHFNVPIDTNKIQIYETEATCTEASYLQTKCLICGEIIKSQFLSSSLGHTKGDVIEVIPPTCTSDGYTKYRCSVCGELFKSDWTYEEHNYSILIDSKSATCTEQGYKKYRCATCDDTILTYTEESLGHTFNDLDICSRCGMLKTDCLESSHPYANEADEAWTLNKPGAQSIAITFSTGTFVENGYDYIYIYDANDVLIGRYTGDSLSGKRIVVLGNTVKIRLTSDNSHANFGFALSKVETNIVQEIESEGIIVTEGKIGDFASDVRLKVENLGSTNSQIKYDISLMQGEDPIQPTAPVTVKIPVPASMNGADCKVYRQEADGTYTDMHAFYQNGYMVFTTDHFSVYVLTTESLGVTLGDINSDGTVDDWDSVLLDRYLAGWDVQVDASVADIDQNGVVDDWDGVLLSRNLAGWKS